MKRNTRFTLLVLCGLLIAADDGRIASGSDRAAVNCMSVWQCCRPEPACCRPQPTYCRPRCYDSPSQNSPERPTQPTVEERDLGTFHWHDAPKRWHLRLPANVSKVEVAFYTEGQDYVTLNASFAGVLQVNEQHVIGFRGQKDGGYVFYNYLEEQEYFVHRTQLPTKGRFVDVTSLIKPRTNEFLYYHYTRTPVGLKVRIHTK